MRRNPLSEDAETAVRLQMKNLDGPPLTRFAANQGDLDRASQGWLRALLRRCRRPAIGIDGSRRERQAAPKVQNSDCSTCLLIRHKAARYGTKRQVAQRKFKSPRRPLSGYGNLARVVCTAERSRVVREQPKQPSGLRLRRFYGPLCRATRPSERLKPVSNSPLYRP
jgi:hypothetical protein